MTFTKAQLDINLKDPYVLAPSKTSDGKPWIQRCAVCLKPVDYLKMKSFTEYIKFGQFVRHKKCLLPPAK
jgi:hypothetical protein